MIYAVQWPAIGRARVVCLSIRSTVDFLIGRDEYLMDRVFMGLSEEIDLQVRYVDRNILILVPRTSLGLSCGL